MLGGRYLWGDVMTSHFEALKSYLSDYRALGEAAALADFESVCQAALHSMRNGQDMVMMRAKNLQELPLVARPYYKQELLASLSKIGHFSVNLTMKQPLSDTLFVSWT